MAQDLIPGNVADFNSEERQPLPSNQISQPSQQELSFLSSSLQDAAELVPSDFMVSHASAQPTRLVSLTPCCPTRVRKKPF